MWGERACGESERGKQPTAALSLEERIRVTNPSHESESRIRVTNPSYDPSHESESRIRVKAGQEKVYGLNH